MVISKFLCNNYVANLQIKFLLEKYFRLSKLAGIAQILGDTKIAIDELYQQTTIGVELIQRKLLEQ